MVSRPIQVVPALTISMLAASRRLPSRYSLGPPPERSATMREAQSLTWAVQWDASQPEVDGFPPVAGYAAFRDVFDFQRGADVRDIIEVAGSKRACVALLRWMCEEARERGLHGVGSVFFGNSVLQRALVRMGYRATRVVYEDVGAAPPSATFPRARGLRARSVRP